MAVAAVAAIGLGAAVGSVTIGWHDLLLYATTGHAADPASTVLLEQIRMPRVITAAAVGAGLGIAGLLMQTLFANPLADPYILGVSSGASLGVALITLGTGTVTGGFVSLVGGQRIAVAAAAATGSALVLMLILVINRWVRSVTTLLIAGVMFSATVGAFTSLLLAFADPTRMQRYVMWGLGSFSGVTRGDLLVLLPVILIAIIIAALLARSLNAMLLGERYARSMGVRVGSVRVLAMIATALIAGAVTAYCGPIAFLGIAVPHLARLTIGSSDHRLLMPASILVGVIASSVCSVVAQLPGDDAVLPINVTAALIGAPVVIVVLLRSRRLSAGAV
ncbi:iron ABC transporter permease [Microlunatus elymi]|uniref:Iron ABC transporter permease n=2 Tax=Microlunatus elymi TaxID=2596828 RepID=A0A516Q592_9ACTN|nr:iron ABC transporter permease [Microlunatus elymi]